MSADELRRRVGALGLTQREMAGRLGLSLNGLFKQLAGERKVSRQTELLLECVEKHQLPKARQPNLFEPHRRRALAKHLYD